MASDFSHRYRRLGIEVRHPYLDAGDLRLQFVVHSDQAADILFAGCNWRFTSSRPSSSLFA
jgi:hypothetical protein